MHNNISHHGFMQPHRRHNFGAWRCKETAAYQLFAPPSQRIQLLEHVAGRTTATGERQQHVVVFVVFLWHGVEAQEVLRIPDCAHVDANGLSNHGCSRVHPHCVVHLQLHAAAATTLVQQQVGVRHQR